MGKVANRINRNRELKQAFNFDKEAFARAIKKVTMATSSEPLVDCQIIAYTAKAGLAELGFNPQIVAGYAAWRVDPHDDAAVTGHHPMMQVKYDHPTDKTVLDGHVWVEMNGDIIDFSTYQIPYKMRLMDAADGRNTRVTWTPEYLWINKREVSTLHDLINGYKTGAYYQPVPALLAQWEAKPPMLDGTVELLIDVYHAERNGIEVELTGATSQFYERLAA